MKALATPVTASVTPGPAVTIATPGRPVRACPSVGHMRGGLLVTGVDYAEVVTRSGRINGIQMSAVEGEDFAYALALERAHKHFAAVDFRHRKVPLIRA